MDTKSRLKETRVNSCLSQEELAEKSGISVKTIQRIETGKSNGNGYTVRKLAEALAVRPVDLRYSSTDGSGVADPATAQLDVVKSMNWRALIVLIIPFSNLVYSASYLRRIGRSDGAPIQIGKRVVSFQIIWTFFTLALMLATQLLWSLFLSPGPIPVFLAVYGLSLFVYVAYTIFLAHLLAGDKRKTLLNLPNLL